MLINFSNHPVSAWSDEQIQAASQWGKPVDFPFPQVPADADEEYVRITADSLVDEIADRHPDAVMCQGEFTLTYAVVRRLIERGITAISACAERRVEERMVDGKYEKTAVFEFTRFREYG